MGTSAYIGDIYSSVFPPSSLLLSLVLPLLFLPLLFPPRPSSQAIEDAMQKIKQAERVQKSSTMMSSSTDFLTTVHIGTREGETYNTKVCSLVYSCTFITYYFHVALLAHRIG